MYVINTFVPHSLRESREKVHQ